MFHSLRKVLYLVPGKERFKILLIYFMMLLAALFELLGIAMIPAFVVVIADSEKIFGLPYIGSFLTQYGITTTQSLAIFGSVLMVTVYLVKNSYLTYFRFFKVKFVYNLRVYLQKRLFKAYLAAPYTFYLKKNSADLLRNVNSEVGKVINGTIMPVLEISLQAFMFVLIIGTLMILEPIITLVTILLMGGGGYLFLKATENRSIDSGRESRQASGDMNRIILQALGGFKDARVLNREHSFLKQFEKFARNHVRASVYQSIIKELPRPIIETLLVTGILAITMIMIFEGRVFTEIIPVLTLFGVAAVKLMPVFNSVINQFSTISYSAYSVNSIIEDLDLLENKYSEFRKKILSESTRFEFNSMIELKNISFKYPETEEIVLKNISLSIKKGSAIAFVGPSGSGKTTLVDIILGLLEPQTGTIEADGLDIYKNIRGWMKNIGYIQQSNYLLDARIFRNIAFGVPDEEIDKAKLYGAIEAAQLEELIQRLPMGLRTTTGERGTRLSGGQQQRIAIARAIYNNPQILVMDEATSALDNLTEKYVIEAIERLRGDRTIIMIAHRLTTVRNCDCIYMMDEGRIVASGTYEELLESSEEFRKMSLLDQ